MCKQFPYPRQGEEKITPKKKLFSSFLQVVIKKAQRTATPRKISNQNVSGGVKVIL